jgi:O-antigen/teichoic acid export membrane protein
MTRSIGLILSGNVVGAALMMMRTLLISRLISLEDFGLGSLFLLALAMIEMMSALGFQQQIIQASDGNSARFQAAVQGLSVLRGVILAIVLFALAGPISLLFAVPGSVWAFQLIAVVPLVSGFVHFDAHRLSRRMEFVPSIILILLPPLGSILSVLPLYHLFGDYRVLLFAIILQMGLSVVVSHCVSKRHYHLRFDGTVILRCLRFGWPLMASGALMFLVFNGERAIIGRALGLETLALFSMALSLTLTPALVLLRSTMSFFLPQLSAAYGTVRYRSLSIAVLQTHIFLGCGMVAAVALLGGPFLTAVVGEKYAAALPFLVWLAVLQAFRVFQGGCAILALAAGHTKNELFANMVRVSLLPLAWLVIMDGGGVMTVIWIGTAGEAAGFAIGLGLVLGKQDLPLRPLLLPLVLAVVLLGVACFLDTRLGMIEAAMALVAVLTAMALNMPDLQAYVRRDAANGHLRET